MFSVCPTGTLAITPKLHTSRPPLTFFQLVSCPLCCAHGTCNSFTLTFSSSVRSARTRLTMAIVRQNTGQTHQVRAWTEQQTKVTEAALESSYYNKSFQERCFSHLYRCWKRIWTPFALPQTCVRICFGVGWSSQTARVLELMPVLPESILNLTKSILNLRFCEVIVRFSNSTSILARFN